MFKPNAFGAKSGVEMIKANDLSDASDDENIPEFKPDIKIEFTRS